MSEKFYLEFLSDNYGKKLIDEPIDYDKCDFNLNQRDKGYARDISFSGGDFMLTFSKWREHELEKLLYYHSTFGFEAKINLRIEFSEENEIIIGQLDFKEAKTDGLTYFKCKVVQDSTQALVKRREDIKVNLLSNETLDGEYIEPLVPENILLKAKPILSKSKWSQPRSYQNVQTPFSLNYFNSINKVDLYGIDNTLSYIQGFGSPNDMRYLYATTDLYNVKISITNLDLSINGFPCFLRYAIGAGELNDNTQYTLDTVINGSFQNSYLIEIPFIERNSIIWIYFKCLGASRLTFNSGEIEITATSVAYNTISPTFRLYDVMKYMAKSIANIDIDAPRFQSGGEFYDQRILNGNFLRNIKDKGFYLTLKELRSYLQEINADNEIDYYSKLFFGLEEDFYKNEEIAFFSSSQFDSLEKSFNQRFAINEFNYKYKYYLSQKENSEENTYDSVHGESQWLLSNKMVENKKEIEIDFYRDVFLLESNRKKGLEDSISKANQDDDKIAIIDSIELQEEDRYFTENAYLQNLYDAETGYNTLRNNGTFSFELLGISVGSNFEIINTNNAGLHTVIEVESNYIVLQRITSGASSFNGEFLTRFKYYVSSDVASYTIRTNEGFTLIDNIENGENFGNLRFSKKRNIVNYWSKYLATCNLYHKEQGIKNTFYKNNPEALTVYEGSQIKEGETFIPENPILSPVLYENVTLLCDKEEFFNIQKDVRTKRGYFRFIDNSGIVIKGYPKNMKYMISESALICDLEEKFESSNLTIDTSTIGIILINNETRVYDFNYKFLDKKLYIYDSNDELLYNPIYWNKVTINGALASSEIELKNWLELI